MNHLSVNFYVAPQIITQTMTKKQLKETLLATEGWILAQGCIWDIKSKHLGAGVFKIHLTQRG